MKDSEYVKINYVNFLYLFIDKVNGCIEESNENKSSILASADKNKEVLTKYRELWNEIKYLIKTINGGEAREDGKDYMKIKFNSGDNFTLIFG